MGLVTIGYPVQSIDHYPIPDLMSPYVFPDSLTLPKPPPNPTLMGLVTIDSPFPSIDHHPIPDLMSRYLFPVSISLTYTASTST